MHFLKGRLSWCYEGRPEGSQHTLHSGTGAARTRTVQDPPAALRCTGMHQARRGLSSWWNCDFWLGQVAGPWTASTSWLRLGTSVFPLVSSRQCKLVCRMGSSSLSCPTCSLRSWRRGPFRLHSLVCPLFMCFSPTLPCISRSLWTSFVVELVVGRLIADALERRSRFGRLLWPLWFPFVDPLYAQFTQFQHAQIRDVERFP